MSELGWEAGSVCTNCPHPISEHQGSIADGFLTLLCEVKGGCDCALRWQYRSDNQRDIQTAPFNQEAVEILGGKSGNLEYTKRDSYIGRGQQ